MKKFLYIEYEKNIDDVYYFDGRNNEMKTRI